MPIAGRYNAATVAVIKTIQKSRHVKQTGAECYNCGWIVSDRFSWCPWCGSDIYEEGVSSEEPLPVGRVDVEVTFTPTGRFEGDVPSMR